MIIIIMQNMFWPHHVFFVYITQSITQSTNILQLNAFQA